MTEPARRLPSIGQLVADAILSTEGKREQQRFARNLLETAVGLMALQEGDLTAAQFAEAVARTFRDRYRDRL